MGQIQFFQKTFTTLTQLGALVAIFLFTACFTDRDDPVVKPVAIERTILVYLAGDSNGLNGELWGADLGKIKEIVKGSKDARCNVLIYADDNKSPTLSKVVRGKDGANEAVLIREYSKENSASKEVLSRVIEDVKTTYPAPHYGMIFFSHGTGWMPAGTYTSLRTIGIDGKDQLDLIDFAAAIPDKTFDFIVFEACLMAGVEVAYELKDKTDYLVVSSAEMYMYGFKDMYAYSMKYLCAPTPDLKGFAKSYFDLKDGNEKTISVIKTSGMEALAHQTQAILKRNGVPVIADGVVQEFSLQQNTFFDYAHYMAQFSTVSEYKLLEQLLDECVIYKAANAKWSSINIVHHSGLTTFVKRPSYPALNLAYDKLAWSKAIGF